jgi:hypothetical protein
MEEYYRDLDEGFNGDNGSNEFHGRKLSSDSEITSREIYVPGPCQLSAYSTKSSSFLGPKFRSRLSRTYKMKRLEMPSIYPD